MIYGDFDDEMRSYVRGLTRSLARGDRHLADDLEQETFVAALQNRPRDPEATRAWLRAIAKNCLRNVAAKTARRPRSVEFTEGAHVPTRGTNSELDPSEAESQRELREVLDRALAKIPRDYANVISMRVVDGYPPRRIAEELGVPVDTVRTRTRRGFERLRIEMERTVGQEDALSETRPLFGFSFLAFPKLRLAAAILAPIGCAIGVLFFINQNREGTGPVAPARNASVASLGNDTARAGQLAGIGNVEGRAPGDRTSQVPAATLAPEVLTSPEDASAPPLAAAETQIAVHVTDRSGRPVAGVELFQHSGFRGIVLQVGSTDANGTCLVAAGRPNHWIAARGAPGWTSEAVLLDQPNVLSKGQVTLELEESEVAWLDVDTRGSALEGEITVTCEAMDTRQLCEQRFDRGLRGASSWLPAWRAPSGSFGILRSDVAKFVCVMSDGIHAWTEGPFHLFDKLPTVITVGAPWTLTGQLAAEDGSVLRETAVRFLAPGQALMSGREVRTDAKGQFIIEELTSQSVVLSVHGIQRRTFRRPEGNRLDAGALILEVSSAELGLRGRVIGVSPPYVVRALTLDGTDLPTTIRLATDSQRDFPKATSEGGEFTLEQSPERVDAIVVHTAHGGPSIAPTFVRRPKSGWPRDGVVIHASPNAIASIQGHIDPRDLPGRLHFWHEETGYRTSAVVPHSESGAFVSPSLSAGTWKVSLQDQAGQFGSCGFVSLGAGETHSMGLVGPKFGRLRFHWPTELQERDPSARVVVSLSRGSEALMNRTFRCDRLAESLDEIRLPVGRYRVVVRGVVANYADIVTIDENKTVHTLLKPKQFVTRVIIPKGIRRVGDATATLELSGPNGERLDFLELGGPEASIPQRIGFVTDRVFPMKVTLESRGHVLTHTIEKPSRPSSMTRVRWDVADTELK